MKIAIYGKGGIGKSTLSANLSAALAQRGKKVLQIGCDPKHDSTRLLLGGKRIVTALDYMRDTPVAIQRLDRVLHTGYRGVVCAEAGGPEPGVGCAGRGILSTFALFERLGLNMNAFDVVLYDVLGDVVCGGFAVPLRRGFADVVYVVTSEEFMSIYAANNILKGVKNFDDGCHRVAGLILNSRGKDEDRRPVMRFASHVSLPIKQTVPRSELFRKAERVEKTVVEAFPDSDEARVFHDLANDLLENKTFYPARFLNEDFLEQLIFKDTPPDTLKDDYQKTPDIPDTANALDRLDTPDSFDPHIMMDGHEQTKEKPAGKIADDNAGDIADETTGKIIFDMAGEMTSKINGESTDEPTGKTLFLSKSMLNREPLHGCAFAGALATTTQIKGTITVAHGPRSCTNIACQSIVSAGLRLFTRKKILLEHQISPPVISSDMDESVVIYGGKENLVNTLKLAMEKSPKALFLVTTCPSGVIGDDPVSAVEEVRHLYPDIPIIPITSDGNLRGDYMQGVLNACMEGAGALIDQVDETDVTDATNLINKIDEIDQIDETDKTIDPHNLCVNILAEKNIAFNAESNFKTIEEILRGMDIDVNCRFVRNTSVDRLKNFSRAPLNLAAYTDYFGRLMADFIDQRLKIPTASLPFPVGFSESAAWVRMVADFFDKRSKGERLIEAHQHHYESMIKTHSPMLKGKRVMIITYVHNIDWIVEAAFDLSMEVVKVCILNFSQDNLFITRYPGRFEVETDYDPAKRDGDIKRLKPDLVLGNYTPKNLPSPIHVDIIPMCPDVGFYGGLTFARRWANLLKAPVTEGWKQDAQ